MAEDKDGNNGSPPPSDLEKETKPDVEYLEQMQKIAEDKDINNGSPPPSDTEKEKKPDAEDLERMLQIAEDKEGNTGSPAPSDTQKEKKSDEENLEQMLRIGPFPIPLSKDEVETLIEDNSNAEIREGIKDTIALVNSKDKTTAIVTFKTAELVEQAKSLLDKIFKVYIGRFDPKTGFRLKDDGTPLDKNIPSTTPDGSSRTETRTCYVCEQPGHIAIKCPTVSSNMLNDTAGSSMHLDERKPSMSERKKSRLCYLCKQPGHIATNCHMKSSNMLNETAESSTPLDKNKPSTTPDGSSRTESRTCYICYQSGHISTNCPTMNDTAGSTQATKRHASDDTLVPMNVKVRKIENDVTQDKKVLILGNLPLTWTRSEIEDYIKEHTKENEDIFKGIAFILLNMAYCHDTKPSKKFTGKCHVRFVSLPLAMEAKQMLNRVTATNKGKKIWASFDNKKWPVLWHPNNKPDFKAMKARDLQRRPKDKDQQFASTHFTTFGRNQSNFRIWQEKQDNDSYPTQNQNRNVFQNNMNLLKRDEDDSGTYGLNPAFLESIGITLPLSSKIVVSCLSNVYDDEEMIRKLFSHAGSVTSVKVVSRVEDTLKVKVEFDHPLEAVQAISMFHNQDCFGTIMQVSMIKNYVFAKRSLPAGLKAFGPGLGKDGLPIKNVRNSIELRNGINKIMDEIAALKISFENQRKDENKANDSTSKTLSNSFQTQSNTSTPVHSYMQNTLATLGSSLTNPIANSSLLALSALLNPQISQELKLLTQQNAGTSSTPGLNTLQTQLNPQSQPSAGWNVTQSADGQNTLGYNYNQPVSTNMQGQNMQAYNTQSNVPYVQTQNMQTYNAQSSVPNMQAYNTQSSVPNVQTQNMQTYNAQSSVPNMQAYNTQSSVPNVQTQNMQTYNAQSSAPNMQGQNMQAYNTQSSVPNVQTQNMQTYNAQSTVPNMQSQNMQAYNTQSSVPNVQTQNMQTYNAQSSLPNMQGQYFQSYNAQKSVPNVPDKPKIRGFQNEQSKTNMQAGANLPSRSNMQGNSHIQGVTETNSDRDGCIVMFHNLPSSVTAAALQAKMCEIGRVRSAVQAGPGRALVSFYSPRDANECISLFHHTKVDGQVIDVKHL